MLVVIVRHTIPDKSPKLSRTLRHQLVTRAGCGRDGCRHGSLRPLERPALARRARAHGLQKKIGRPWNGPPPPLLHGGATQPFFSTTSATSSSADRQRAADARATGARQSHRTHPARAAPRPQAAWPPISRHAPSCARRRFRAPPAAPRRPARVVVLEQDEFCGAKAAGERHGRTVGRICLPLRVRAHAW